jgi:hypothetical protein
VGVAIEISLAEFAAAAAKKLKSFSAAACTWQKILIGLQTCELGALYTTSVLQQAASPCRKSPVGFYDS